MLLLAEIGASRCFQQRKANEQLSNSDLCHSGYAFQEECEVNWDHLKLYKEVYGLGQSCLKQQDRIDKKVPAEVPSIPMYCCADQIISLLVRRQMGLRYEWS